MIIYYLELGDLGKYFQINNAYLRKSHFRQSKSKFLMSLVLPCFPTSYHKRQPDELTIIKENDRVSQAYETGSACLCPPPDRGSKVEA